MILFVNNYRNKTIYTTKSRCNKEFKHKDARPLKALGILKKKPRGWRGRLAELKLEMGWLNNTALRKEGALEHWGSLEE